MIKNLTLLLLFTLFLLKGLAQEISKERKMAIDSLALEKVKDLGKYISIIGNKDTPQNEASRVVERAVELFESGSLVSVSSLNHDKIRSYPARKYFQRLMLLNYDRVTVEWYSIRYVSDLERQPDGKYVGVITVFQRFKGENDDGIKYVDITKKDITIYVERKETQISGRIIGFWDVLLGDIKVTETKK